MINIIYCTQLRKTENGKEQKGEADEKEDYFSHVIILDSKIKKEGKLDITSRILRSSEARRLRNLGRGEAEPLKVVLYSPIGFEQDARKFRGSDLEWVYMFSVIQKNIPSLAGP